MLIIYVFRLKTFLFNRQNNTTFNHYLIIFELLNAIVNMNKFSSRHIGINNIQKEEMLDCLGLNSMEQLISETIPKNIRLKKELDLDDELSENEFLTHIDKLSKKNKNYKSYIGLGYHQSITPSVIKRNILENPSWYTAYTPYQAEIAQ